MYLCTWGTGLCIMCRFPCLVCQSKKSWCHVNISPQEVKTSMTEEFTLLVKVDTRNLILKVVDKILLLHECTNVLWLQRDKWKMNDWLKTCNDSYHDGAGPRSVGHNMSIGEDQAILRHNEARPVGEWLWPGPHDGTPKWKVKFLMTYLANLEGRIYTPQIKMHDCRHHWTEARQHMANQENQESLKCSHGGKELW